MSLMDLKPTERVTLAVAGVVGLAGLGVWGWQQQRPALTFSAAPLGAQSARWDALLDGARRIDVNTAGVAELERLPGVGPALASRIVGYRTRHGRFRTAEELSRVPGIGPKTYEAMKGHITIGD